MRGLYFLTIAVVLVGSVAASSHRVFNKNDLPSYMRNMSPQEIKREILAFMSKDQRSSIDDALVVAIQKFQEMMKSGIPAMGIPVLDPLFIPRLEYNLTSDLMAVKGFIAQSTVQELSAFNINKVKVNPLRLAIDFDFLWAAINFGGLYDIDGVLTVLPIYGTGPFTLTLQNFGITGKLDLGTRIMNQTVYIKSLDLDITLESIVNNFEGLLGGGAMGDMMNDMITDMAPELLNSVKAQILAPISDLIVSKANSVLINYTMGELIDIIMKIAGGGDTTTVAPILRNY